MAGPVAQAENVAPSAGAEDATEVSTAPVFDVNSMTKKKKKKKPKAPTETTEAAPAAVAPPSSAMSVAESLFQMEGDIGLAEEETLDFELSDFTSNKKKKKKKKVFFDDDQDDGIVGLDRSSRRQIVDQPWDGTDRDYTYTELINRAFQFLHGKNPALAAGSTGRKKISLQLPQVAREGTKKTVFLNFGVICKSIHRQQEHVLQFMGAELGTTGNIQDGGRLVVKGRFTAEAIAKVLKRYMKEYVICTSCRSPDTVLMRDANTRLYFVSCESCGAKRSVQAVRQGFMAQVERRRRG